MAASITRLLGVRSAACASRSPLAALALHPATQPGSPVTADGGPQVQRVHTSAVAHAWNYQKLPRHFLAYNKKVYPPTPLGEPERPAFICHQKTNIKYCPSKMWYVACLVRGMKIDEAIAQLKFVHKKGATAVRETLEEARELAVKDHCVEFPSNLWVSESKVGKGIVYRGVRRHARRRFGRVEYKHCHYFVSLEEGEPPEHYYHYSRPLTPQEMLEEWLDSQRKRVIPKTL